MRKTALFIAASLDGFIADSAGSVDWLYGHNEETPEDTYKSFARRISTVIMGWTTYHQIASELSPDEWPYNEMETYVLTHRKKPNQKNIIFTASEPVSLVRELKEKKDKKDIWICGGASVVQPLVKENLIDEYIISIVPVLLGQGTRLFDSPHPALRLHLDSTSVSDGIIEMKYTRR